MKSIVVDHIKQNRISAIDALDYCSLELIQDAYDYIRLMIQYRHYQMLEHSLKLWPYMYGKFEEVILNDFVPNGEDEFLRIFINSLNDRNNSSYINELLVTLMLHNYNNLIKYVIDKFPNSYIERRNENVLELYANKNVSILKYDLEKFGDYSGMVLPELTYSYGLFDLKEIHTNGMYIDDKIVFELITQSTHDPETLLYFIENILFDVNIITLSNTNLLMEVLSSGVSVNMKYRMVEILINKGIDLFIDSKSLHSLVFIKSCDISSHLDIIKLIIDRTANVDIEKTVACLFNVQRIDVDNRLMLLNSIFNKFNKNFEGIDLFGMVVKHGHIEEFIINVGQLLIGNGIVLKKENKYLEMLSYLYTYIPLGIINFLVDTDNYMMDEVSILNIQMLRCEEQLTSLERTSIDGYVQGVSKAYKKMIIGR